MKTRRSVLLLALAGALVCVATASRTWLTGSVRDAVLGSSSVSATGSTVAAGFVGLTLVVLAGLVAAAVTGVGVRLLAAGLALLAGVGAFGQTLWVVADPSARLGPVAAAAVGRTGSLSVEGERTGWLYAAVAGALLLLLAAVLGCLGVRGWPAPSARYDAPTAKEGEVSGARGQRVSSTWDQLSAGEDPTDAPEHPRT